MSIILRTLLIVFSLISFIYCIIKVKQSKIKIADSIVWILGSFILILMSIFANAVEWISYKLGFIAPVNFVYLVIIAFALIQMFIDNTKIAMLNEKVKNLDHYIALQEYKNKSKKNKEEQK